MKLHFSIMFIFLFQIVSLVTIKIFGFDFSITNAILVNMLCLLCFSGTIYFFNVRNNNLNTTSFFFIPNPWQIIFESAYEVVSQLVFDLINADNEKYLPFITIIFSFILFNNLTVLIPYSFTMTSHLIITFTLSFFIFIGLNIICYQKHGFYIFSLFLIMCKQTLNFLKENFNFVSFFFLICDAPDFWQFSFQVNSIFLLVEQMKIQEFIFLSEYFLIMALFCLSLFVFVMFFLFKKKSKKKVSFKFQYDNQLHFLVILILTFYLILLYQQTYVTAFSLYFFSKFILGFSFISYLFFLKPYLKNQKLVNFEYYTLLFVAILGFFLLYCENEFIVACLSIELQILVFYVLSIFKKSRGFLMKNNIKYFIFGAFFLLGVTFGFNFSADIFLEDLRTFIHYSYIYFFLVLHLIGTFSLYIVLCRIKRKFLIIFIFYSCIIHTLNFYSIITFFVVSRDLKLLFMPFIIEKKKSFLKNFFFFSFVFLILIVFLNNSLEFSFLKNIIASLATIFSFLYFLFEGLWSSPILLDISSYEIVSEAFSDKFRGNHCSSSSDDSSNEGNDDVLSTFSGGSFIGNTGYAPHIDDSDIDLSDNESDLSDNEDKIPDVTEKEKYLASLPRNPGILHISQEKFSELLKKDGVLCETNLDALSGKMEVLFLSDERLSSLLNETDGVLYNSKEVLLPKEVEISNVTEKKPASRLLCNLDGNLTKDMYEERASRIESIMNSDSAKATIKEKARAGLLKQSLVEKDFRVGLLKDDTEDLGEALDFLTESERKQLIESSLEEAIYCKDDSVYGQRMRKTVIQPFKEIFGPLLQDNTVFEKYLSDFEKEKSDLEKEKLKEASRPDSIYGGQGIREQFNELQKEALSCKPTKATKEIDPKFEKAFIEKYSRQDQPILTGEEIRAQAAKKEASDKVWLNYFPEDFESISEKEKRWRLGLEVPEHNKKIRERLTDDENYGPSIPHPWLKRFETFDPSVHRDQYKRSPAYELAVAHAQYHESVARAQSNQSAASDPSVARAQFNRSAAFGPTVAHSRLNRSAAFDPSVADQKKKSSIFDESFLKLVEDAKKRKSKPLDDKDPKKQKSYGAAFFDLLKDKDPKDK